MEVAHVGAIDVAHAMSEEQGKDAKISFLRGLKESKLEPSFPAGEPRPLDSVDLMTGPSGLTDTVALLPPTSPKTATSETVESLGDQDPDDQSEASLRDKRMLRNNAPVPPGTGPTPTPEPSLAPIPSKVPTNSPTIEASSLNPSVAPIPSKVPTKAPTIEASSLASFSPSTTPVTSLSSSVTSTSTTVQSGAHDPSPSSRSNDFVCETLVVDGIPHHLDAHFPTCGFPPLLPCAAAITGGLAVAGPVLIDGV